METKKIFTVPVCEVTRFSVEDIVASSGGWYTSIEGISDVSNYAESE
jgi:hypothetical protein